MTSTRSNRRPPLAPLNPSTLKPQVPTTPTFVDEYCLSPDSPPDDCPRSVLVPLYRTPLTHHRVLTLRRPTQCRREQDDIEEIVCFLNRISWCVARVYQAIWVVAASVFHGTMATVQWLAVVAFVVEVIVSMGFSSTRSDHGGGFIGPIVDQLTSTAIATGHAKADPSPHTRTSEAVVLNFLSDQIGHAHDLLTVVGGLGDDAFFEYHQTNVRHFLSRARSDTLSGGSKTAVNLTVDFRGLDSTLIQSLSPHGFIGRMISHALDEVTHHSKRTQTAFLIRRSTVRESRLDSVLLLTASNLLLEFSSILSQTEGIILDVEAIHRQLSHNLPEGLASLQSHKTATSRRSIWAVFAGQRVDPRTVEEESVQAFMTGLKTVIANLRQLKAYLEWITNQLVGLSSFPSSWSLRSFGTAESTIPLAKRLDRDLAYRPILFICASGVVGSRKQSLEEIEQLLPLSRLQRLPCCSYTDGI
ncbi:hypothetical protein AZE42_02459 [Rhizopogon vesiculosus]|uniref:Uncharacterized protein n=1 Tax=Rhizopogon vesiculosus TaxID=180088 RepID=A0A1J8Q9W7_9AGAM|nr:hypothetical protein AZE42_02459 [Rhizopogon vesiculosus]